MADANFGQLTHNDSMTASQYYIYGFRFQNTAGTGNLKSITVHSYLPTGNCHLGVYADDGDSPSTLLLDTGSVAMSNNDTIVTGLTLAVTLNAYYWLAVHCDVATTIWGTPTGVPANCRATDQAIAYAALKDPFPATHSHYAFWATIWATVEAGGTNILQMLI